MRFSPKIHPTRGINIFFLSVLKSPTQIGLGCPRKCFFYFRRNTEFLDKHTEFRGIPRYFYSKKFPEFREISRNSVCICIRNSAGKLNDPDSRFQIPPRIKKSWWTNCTVFQFSMQINLSNKILEKDYNIFTYCSLQGNHNKSPSWCILYNYIVQFWNSTVNFVTIGTWDGTG